MHTISIIVGTSLLLIAWQIFTLKYSKKIKFLIFLLLSLGILYMPLGIFLELGLIAPYFIVVIFSIFSAISIIVVSIGVLRFFISIFSILFLFTRGGRNITKYMFLSSQVSYISLVIAILFGFFSFYEAYKVPNIKEYELTYKNLPQGLDGYKIAHITDTHVGVLFREKWSKQVVQKIQSQNANLIVHTGDIADGMPSQVKSSIEPFLKLSAKDGVYYIMGNHENYHSISKWREFYKNHNLNILEDEYKIHDTLPLVVAGAAAAGRTTPTNYEKLLKGVPKDSFILLLDHYPNRANASKKFVNLQLSGHTHGGTTFYLAPIVAKFNGGFVNGLYEINENMKLFVSSCAGLWSYVSLRLFVPSEIAIIKLKRGV